MKEKIEDQNKEALRRYRNKIKCYMKLKGKERSMKKNFIEKYRLKKDEKLSIIRF